MRSPRRSNRRQLLAGKYKNAEELEKAYVELQKKLGDNKEEETEHSKCRGARLRRHTYSYPKVLHLITDASKRRILCIMVTSYRQRLLAKFSSLSSQDLIKAYMEVSQPVQSFNNKCRQHHQLRLLHHRSIRSRTQQAERKPMLI